MVTALNDIHKKLQHLNSILPQAMLTDRIHVKRRLKKVRQSLKKGTARQDLKKVLHTIEKQINTSITTKTLRHERLPSTG